MVQIILIGILAGLLGTFAMDRVASFAVKNRIVDLNGLQIVPCLLGRWSLLMVRRFQFVFIDIRLAPTQRREARIGFTLHYAIGIFLGLVFAFGFRGHTWMNGLFFGILTNAFPWLLMYPAMGFGFFGSHLPVKKEILKFSFVNHAIYGLVVGLIFQVALGARPF